MEREKKDYGKRKIINMTLFSKPGHCYLFACPKLLENMALEGISLNNGSAGEGPHENKQELVVNRDVFC